MKQYVIYTMRVTILQKNLYVKNVFTIVEDVKIILLVFYLKMDIMEKIVKKINISIQK